MFFFPCIYVRHSSFDFCVIISWFPKVFSRVGATKSNPLLKKKESLIMVDRQKALVEKTGRSTSFGRYSSAFYFISFFLECSFENHIIITAENPSNLSCRWKAITFCMADPACRGRQDRTRSLPLKEKCGVFRCSLTPFSREKSRCHHRPYPHQP